MESKICIKSATYLRKERADDACFVGRGHHDGLEAGSDLESGPVGSPPQGMITTPMPLHPRQTQLPRPHHLGSGFSLARSNQTGS